MTPARDNLIEAMEGRTPETTPYSVYDWNMKAVTSQELSSRMQDPDWKRLLDMGLGISHHCEILDAIEEGVEASTEANRNLLSRTPGQHACWAT